MRCCWSTPPRASRRRRWPTCTWRSTATCTSSRCSTRSTCPPPTRTATRARSRTSSAANPATCCGCPARPGRASPSCSTTWCARCRRRRATPTRPTRAMIFDSVYDIYRGVVTYVRVIDGKIIPRERIKMMSTGATHELLEVGIVSPEPKPSAGLGVGEVGYLITGVKDVRQSKVGDTVTTARHGATRGADRLPRTQADGLLRAVSRRRIGLPGPARRAGEAAAQRRGADVRAGDVGGAGLRLPVRLPRSAAHGDHPRAAGARVRPGPDLDVAQRRVPGDQGGRHRDRR